MMNADREMSILLVEDDTVDAENVRRALPRRSNLHVAMTLSDAIKAIDETTHDLVLLDPGLPDCSGVDSFVRIRQAAPSVPIVVLTGLEDRQLAVKIIRMGAQDYLLKNQLDERMVHSLRFAIERERLLQQIQFEQAERERLSADLREQEQQLAHLGRVALMGELVAELSHEVSQPFNVISILTAALEKAHQQSPLDTEQCQLLIEKLGEANSLAGDILRRLRDFIRNEDVEFERFDMNEVVESTVAFVNHERQQRRIMLCLDLATEPLVVNGNKTQIRQVIVNLLRNAFDAMVESDETGRGMEIRSYREGKLVHVEVADQGTGLRLDVPSAFAAFKTTKDGGLGMGLAICSRIVQNHGGEINFVGGGHAGTTIRFGIPGAGNGYDKTDWPGR